MNSRAHILVVDDEDSIRFSFRRFLSDNGYEVTVSANPSEAKTMLGKNIFDVAVVDRLYDSDQDGLDLVRHIRETQSSCQTIMMSAYPSFNSAAEGIRNNIIAYLTKPVNKQTICQVVEEAIQRKEQIKGQHRTEAIFQWLVNGCSIAMAICDQFGNIKFVNCAFERLFGFNINDLRNNCDKFIPELDRQQTKADLASFRRGQSSEGRFTMRFNKQGNLVPVAITYADLSQNSESTTDIIMLIEDKTDIKNKERQLINVQRLENVSHMAAGFCHDFNNYLNVIGANAELMKMKKDGAHPEYKFLANICSAIQSSNGIVRQLIQLGKENETSARIVELNSAVEKIGEMLKSIVTRRIELKVEYSPKPVPVHIIYTQLEQCLMNMVINARDAIMEKISTGYDFGCDTPKITLQVQSVDPAARDSDWKQNNWKGRCGCIHLSDNGIGVAEPIRDMIFDPFFSTKKKDQGTGLGLAMVKTIIENHKGKLQMESQYGKGTTFHIYLPQLNDP